MTEGMMVEERKGGEKGQKGWRGDDDGGEEGKKG